jgi:hypothetical protein
VSVSTNYKICCIHGRKEIATKDKYKSLLGEIITSSQLYLLEVGINLDSGLQYTSIIK